MKGLGTVVQSELIPPAMLQALGFQWVVGVAYPGVDVRALISHYAPMPLLLVCLSMRDIRAYSSLTLCQLLNEPNEANQGNIRPEEYAAIGRALTAEGHAWAGPAVSTWNDGDWLNRFAGEVITPATHTMHGYGVPLANLSHDVIYSEIGPEGPTLATIKAWSGQGTSPFADWILQVKASGLAAAIYQAPQDANGTPSLVAQKSPGQWQYTSHGLSLLGLNKSNANPLKSAL